MLTESMESLAWRKPLDLLVSSERLMFLVLLESSEHLKPLALLQSGDFLALSESLELRFLDAFMRYLFRLFSLARERRGVRKAVASTQKMFVPGKAIDNTVE